jgi:beta-phosphoglucomutase-like phosphatase (HAD superfamily)
MRAFTDEGMTEFDHTICAGKRTDEVVESVLLAHGRDASREEVARVTALKRHYSKLAFEESVPTLDNAEHLLKTLRSRFKVALATSASRNSANAFLGSCNGLQYFNATVCGPEVRICHIRAQECMYVCYVYIYIYMCVCMYVYIYIYEQVEGSKPEPDIYLRAMEMVDSKPETCMVIEDSLNGIRAGHAAGTEKCVCVCVCKCMNVCLSLIHSGCVVLAVRGTHKEDELLAEKPIFVMDTANDLLQLFAE